MWVKTGRETTLARSLRELPVDPPTPDPVSMTRTHSTFVPGADIVALALEFWAMKCL